MKQYIFPAIRLTLVCIVFFMGIYPLLILAGTQLAPGRGKGETICVNGKVVGWKLLGQQFTEDKYFQGRPSAVDYNAAGSGGSNKGPTNPGYLKTVQDRIDTFLMHNHGINKIDIPSDLVTASGSGLDPDISVQGAFVQVKRIAAVRNIPEEKIKAMVRQHIKRPLWGLLGPASVNVLPLNIDLDKLQ
jgi:potassium-transporting ATPase KdpC subunit